MNSQSLKRAFNQSFEDMEENQPANPDVAKKAMVKKSTFLNLCNEIVLEVFQYLRPLDLLYSFMGLSIRVDNLLEPYTPRMDFRFVQKFYFQCLLQALFPHYAYNLRILRLSDAYTFGQISEAFSKIDWSQITQLESLTFDHIAFEELSKYFLTIHSSLKYLWRLSLTFNENDKYVEKLLIDYILNSSNQSQLLKTCFISGITFDLSKLSIRTVNENLRELKITLSTIGDLIRLFQLMPHLEILTCTITDDSSTDNNNYNKVKSLDYLTILTLTIEKPIRFRHLEEILMPHLKLERLSLKAKIFEESSANKDQTINGFILEKLFRRFLRLQKLDFFILHGQFSNVWVPSPVTDDTYLFSFTSYFWLTRSIKVATHYIHQSKLRYVYTLPFAYDSFEISDDIKAFFTIGYSYYYANVRHLLLSSKSNLDQSIYSNVITKFFPNIKTITFSEKPSLNMTINVMNNNHWIQQKSSPSIYSTRNSPYAFVRNTQKTTHLHIRTLNRSNKDEILSKHNSKRIRHITIYEMNKETLTCLIEFFPCIRILTLYTDTSDWYFPSSDYLCHLVNDMNSLFSLTIYAPKYLIDQNLLAVALLNVKKPFYIKCSDGILNMWF